ncbi:MAG: Gfo/Idh/MocA family oxidoreductase [Sphaerochaetaceae bacterium]|nr:Gfo/Idh/MocA family oxidoreductase [Sphaerochaetaceae bacterium]
MNIGIIGCGIITQEAHIPALLRLQDKIKVRALCNHSEEKGKIVRNLLNDESLPIYSNWKEMIEKEKGLDAVLIALPIKLSYEVSKGCLDAGVAVLCEKPVGADTTEAHKTRTWASEKYPLYMTGENFHFKRATMKALKIIESGRIGTLHSIQMNVFKFMFDDNKYNKTLWRSNNRYPGGYLMDGGVHNVHTIQQFAGPVESVMAKTLSVNPRLGTHDTGFAILKHTGGILTSYNMAMQHEAPAEGIKLFGTKGSLIVKDDEIKVISPEGDVEVISVQDENTFYLEWLEFYNAYTAKTGSPIPQDMVINDVMIIEKMLESSDEGKEVYL